MTQLKNQSNRVRLAKQSRSQSCQNALVKIVSMRFLAFLFLGIVTTKQTLACVCADGSDDIGKRFQESEELYAVKNLEVSEDLLTIRILQVLKGDRQLTGQIVKDIKLERASSCSLVPTVQSVGDIYITEHPGVFRVCSWPIELNLVFEDPSLLAKLRELDPNGLLERFWIGSEKEKFEQKQDYLRFQLGEFKMGEVQRAWFLEDNSRWQIMLAMFLGIAIPFAAGGARAGTKRAFSCALIMLVAMTVSLIVFLLSFDWLYTKDIELWMFVILFIYIFGFAISMYIALRKPKTSPL